MTLEELHEATAAWREASRAEIRLRPERDQLIRQALRAGLTHRTIAEAAGVSHGLPARIWRAGGGL